MQKADLVDGIAKDAGLTKSASDRVLNAFVDAVTRTLKKGEKVTLVGFGTFSVSKRAARTGRNPRTGQTIQIKASRVPKFTAGKSLKDSVRR